MKQIFLVLLLNQVLDAKFRRSNGIKWRTTIAEIRINTMGAAGFPSSIGNLHSWLEILLSTLRHGLLSKIKLHSWKSILFLIAVNISRTIFSLPFSGDETSSRFYSLVISSWLGWFGFKSSASAIIFVFFEKGVLLFSQNVPFRSPMD